MKIFLKLFQCSIKLKHRNKLAGEIKDIVDNKMKSFLTEEEWKEIITYIYEPNDQKNIENRIIDYIRKKYPNKNLEQQLHNKYYMYN